MSNGGSGGASERYLRPRAAGTGDAWAEEAAERGHVGTQRLLDALVVIPPERVAQALALNSGDQVVRRRRLILEDDIPVEVTTSYYPASWAAPTPLGATRRIPGGAVTLLASLGMTPRGGHEEWVRVDLASKEMAELLAVGIDSPVLAVARLLKNSAHVPYEFMEMSLRPGRELHYRFLDGA